MKEIERPAPSCPRSSRHKSDRHFFTQRRRARKEHKEKPWRVSPQTSETGRLWAVFAHFVTILRRTSECASRSVSLNLRQHDPFGGPFSNVTPAIMPIRWHGK